MNPRPLTSYFKLLQVAIVLGAVEEETSLTFRALDEPIRSQKFFYHTSLSHTRACAVGICSVPIVMEHTWVKTHLQRRLHVKKDPFITINQRLNTQTCMQIEAHF